ncbi:MAG TPA: hypothetical protein VFB42_07140 [Gaiellaceae bacterium]|nr:hypothetical protein [Gaiellaceae bacterium]
MGKDDEGRGGSAGSAWDALAALGAIGAGVYLLASQTADPNSYLQTIAHGLGVYFVAKGVYMGRTTHLLSQLLDRARDVEKTSRDRP